MSVKRFNLSDIDKRNKSSLADNITKDDIMKNNSENKKEILKLQEELSLINLKLDNITKLLIKK